MTLEEFKADLLVGSAEEVVLRHLCKSKVIACNNAEHIYQDFRTEVNVTYPNSSAIYIVGSGNWEYSLAPEKNYKPFDDSSDIDVAVVSEQDFVECWEVLREYHRRSWYVLRPDVRRQLARSGQNVYSGFVSPAWIPERGNLYRFSFLTNANRLSGTLVNNKPVKIMFFRNNAEVVDYYKRGIILARGGLAHGL